MWREKENMKEEVQINGTENPFLYLRLGAIRKNNRSINLMIKALCNILQDEETMYAYEGAFSDTEALE